jgi:hypothetical protein
LTRYTNSGIAEALPLNGRYKGGEKEVDEIDWLVYYNKKLKRRFKMKTKEDVKNLKDTKEAVISGIKKCDEFLFISSKGDDMSATGFYKGRFINEVLSFIVKNHENLFAEFVLMEAIRMVGDARENTPTPKADKKKKK